MQSEPVAYGYVYHDHAGRRVIRYGGTGGEVNGSKPVEVIPLYTRPATDAAPCPSCNGLNTSCPDGCGRDPTTGELNGTDAAPDGLDWKLIAKAAGEHGIRYRTNTALAQFLAEIRFVPAARITALEAALAERDATIAGLLSDASVDAAAKAHCDYFGGDGWWDTGLLADTLPKAREAMRASLEAALHTVDGEAG